jgi:hypothetical protein
VPSRTASRALLATALLSALALTAYPSSGATRPAYRSTGAPTYQSFPGPGTASDAGEPSIGVNWRTGAVFLQAGLETNRIAFSDDKATWTSSSAFTTSLLTLDPIAFSDDATGRFFVSQLTAAGSLMAYTDDDGATWSTSQGAGLPAGVDHQTVGGGPYPEGSMGPLTAYKHAVYYCSQDIATAFCARSDTGGLTFGAGVPIYTLADCGGLHGHVKVAPDGTVYVPNSDCNGTQAVAVSRDAGATWSIHPVPGATSGDSDPSVAIGRDGTVYFTYADNNSRIRVAVSRNHGNSWTAGYDVGRQLGVVNTVFPSAIAGDGDRAAVAFLGTRTPGDAQNVNFGKDQTRTAYVGADYHLYVSTTYDRGRTWQTVDVTPQDPVQRGRVCMGGTSCSGSDRNLLDFMDIQVDRRGMVLVGWPDGCTGVCVDENLVATNRHTSRGNVSVQTGGEGLFATPPRLAG